MKINKGQAAILQDDGTIIVRELEENVYQNLLERPVFFNEDGEDLKEITVKSGDHKKVITSDSKNKLKIINLTQLDKNCEVVICV